MSCRRLVFAAFAIVVLGLVGCDESSSRGMANLPARGYHPDSFPDIPLAPTFALKPGRDQLAIAVGGGLIRRFDVGLVQKPQAKTQTPGEVLDWYGKMLPGFGWNKERGEAGELRFRRERSPEVAEILHVRSSAHIGVTSLDLLLEPAAAVRTTP